MITFDIVLLILLGGFVLFGLWFGFIHTLGSLIGIIAGAFIASHYYVGLADWGGFIWGKGDLGFVISFIIILIFINRLIGLIFYFFDRAFELISIIPFITSINRLSGAVLGFLEGSLTLGLILFFLSRYPVNEWMADQLSSSVAAPWLIGMAKVLAPLLPELLKQLHSIL